MKIVLDTNVIVSGFIHLHGKPGQIIAMVSSGDLTLCYDNRVISEYREVLLRPKFSFDHYDVDGLLLEIKSSGQLVAPLPLPTRLPDESDEPFLEVALAGQAVCLVTGNLRHYPDDRLQGMPVISPTEFLDVYRTLIPKL